MGLKASLVKRNSKKMAFEVEVLKIDYPEMEAMVNFTCKLENKESGERIYETTETKRDEMPVFKFITSKPISHNTWLEFHIASRECSNPCSSLTPLHLMCSSSVKSPPDICQDVRLVHMSAPIVHTKFEKVMARVWFKVNNLQQQPKVQMETSSSRSTSGLKQIFSKERSTVCDFSYTVKLHPTILVVFHTVSVQEQFSSAKITPTAFLETTPVDNLTTILNKGQKLNVIPIFRTIALKCLQDDGRFLQMHLMRESEATPQFSVSIPLSNLQPFRPYNWSFNQKWNKTSFKFKPSDDQINVDTNMITSLIYLPASSAYSDYEGLELYIEPFLLETDGREDVILSLQMLDVKKASSELSAQSAGEEEARGNNEDGADTAIAVLQSHEADIPISSPAYFFIASCPQLYRDFKISLKVYSVEHNSKPWWESSEFSSIEVDFASKLRQEIFSIENKQGLKLKFTKDAIEQNFKEVPLFEQLNVIVRWKTKDMRFLSEPEIIPNEKNASGPSENTMEALARDIEKLRMENDLLKKENRGFEKYILDIEASVVAKAAEQSHLLHLTKYDLVERVVKLSEHLEGEREVRKTIQARADKLRASLIKRCHIEADFNELQRAHLFQQRLLRELQEKVVKYKKSIHICRQQDLTITNLEKALCRQSGDVKTKMAMMELRRENGYLRALIHLDSSASSISILAEKDKTIAALQKEVSSLSKKIQKFQSARQYDLALEGLDLVDRNYQREKQKYDEMKRRLAMAEIREKVAIKELLAERSEKNAKYKSLPVQTRDDSSFPGTADYISYQLRQKQRQRQNVSSPSET